MNTHRENTSGKGLHYYGALHEIDGLINAAMPTIAFSMVRTTGKNKKLRRKLGQSLSMIKSLSLASN